jgi:hypothetical protein
MTDKEFFATLTTLRGHAKARQQEAFAAGTDLEKFKEWESLYTDLDNVLRRRRMDRTMKKWAKFPGGSGKPTA